MMISRMSEAMINDGQSDFQTLSVNAFRNLRVCGGGRGAMRPAADKPFKKA